MSIDPADLASMLELMARALRQLAPVTSQGQTVEAQSSQAKEPQRTLNDWLDVHAKILLERGYKAQTIRNRTGSIFHVRKLWGSRAITAIKPHEVATQLKTFGPERTSTAGRVLAELRAIYTEAIANGWAETNPAAHIKAPRHKVIRARLRLETWQAMRELAKAGPQRWVESLLLLALVTGQRRADLAVMRFDHIVAGYLRVEQQKQAGKGYGARVEIPLDLRLNVIGMSVGDVVEHCRQSARPGATLLRKAGGGAIEKSSLSGRFAENIRAVLGDGAHALYEWPSLHEVRSLAARLYDEQGVDVQTLLGHKHSEMTAVYKDDRGLSRDEYKRVSATPSIRGAAT